MRIMMYILSLFRETALGLSHVSTIYTTTNDRSPGLACHSGQMALTYLEALEILTAANAPAVANPKIPAPPTQTP